MEGSRLFDEAWGLVAAGVCLAVAVPTLWWWLPEHRRAFFPRAVDPSYRLQLGYGLFGMAMAGTNFGCRFIPHAALEAVHPAFFLIPSGWCSAWGRACSGWRCAADDALDSRFRRTDPLVQPISAAS